MARLDRYVVAGWSVRIGVAVALALGAFAAPPPLAAADPAPPRPNVLLVLVDDQAMNTFTPRFEPNTYRWIVRPGTKFTSGVAAPPLCCPDRAGILTGQYPHNNGVFSNEPGYPTLMGKDDTLPVWLTRAGYRTGFVGRFLNGYFNAEGYTPAPGFATWFATDDPTRYFNYTVSTQGGARFFGNTRHDYTTGVFTRSALRFIRAPDPRPFFLWLAYNAPHASHLPAAHCEGYDPSPPSSRAYLRFDRLHLPHPPSFNEADVSDKPQAIASLPLLDAVHIGAMERRYRCTAAALHSVDEAVDHVMHALRHRGELRRTIVIYVSDNGYFFGEHRIDFGKSFPYEPALQVPYAVRVPAAYRPAPAPAVSPAVVTNQDLTATILDYAGRVPPCAAPDECRTVDGRSLRPLLGGPGTAPADRGALAELNSEGIEYSALRTGRYMYAEYADGERELYDLALDPSELQSVAGDPAYAAAESNLAARLSALRTCSGHVGANPCE